MLKKLDKKQKILLTLITIVFIAFCCTLYLCFFKQNTPQEDESGSAVIPFGPSETSTDWLPKGWNTYDIKEEWLQNKNINFDYQGEIVFESGLVDQSVVQARSIYDREGNFHNIYTMGGHKVTEEERFTGCDGIACTGNDVYLWTYWKTGEYDRYEHGGSVFMDYRTDISDQNIIIYGHHFSQGTEEERMAVGFTPFEKLMTQENYAANNKLWLILDGEMREYEIASVYEAQLIPDGDVYLVNEETPYFLTSYTKEEFESYYANLQKYELYETGVELEYTDRLLTLQTCLTSKPDKRLIILCKEVSRHFY